MAGVAASHTYTTGDARTVMLTVTDDHGNSDTDSVLATSTDPVEPGENQPPVAHASATCAGSGLHVQCRRLDRPGERSAEYAWDFGTAPSGVRREYVAHVLDGRHPDGHAHRHRRQRQLGADTVVATTTDAAVDQPPDAHATATCAALDCTFSAADSTDPENEALSYAWDFGDGNQGSGVSTSHTYSTGAITDGHTHRHRRPRQLGHRDGGRHHHYPSSHHSDHVRRCGGNQRQPHQSCP